MGTAYITINGKRVPSEYFMVCDTCGERDLRAFTVDLCQGCMARHRYAEQVRLSMSVVPKVAGPAAWGAPAATPAPILPRLLHWITTRCR